MSLIASNRLVTVSSCHTTRTRNAARISGRICEGGRTSTVSVAQVNFVLFLLIRPRYTITFSPSLDQVTPAPTHLHVKVKNTSAIPLRAAYLHGPYTLYAACYPSTFNPNHRDDSPGQRGNPDFEPNLKAGGSWLSSLVVPEDIRGIVGEANASARLDKVAPSCTWIVEISSQVIFSTTATVHFEVLIGRDERSVDLGFSALSGQGVAKPGQLHDHQQIKGNRGRKSHNATQQKGVFSKAVFLEVDDTESLWNKPSLPESNENGTDRVEESGSYPPDEQVFSAALQMGEILPAGGSTAGVLPLKKPKKVHLVVITHGLHSNLGVDMLYLKESIDAAAKKARQDARKRRANRSSVNMYGEPSPEQPGEVGDIKDGTPAGPQSRATSSGAQCNIDTGDEEEVIVRGFFGNCVRTERGIQYLGKRLAKYVLEMAYPDQPFLPAQKNTNVEPAQVLSEHELPPEDSEFKLNNKSHRHSKNKQNRAYRVTSISFVAHSLGGLTQTYAIAYIQKHFPLFFKEIKPINFVAMASPFLGLSNENPLYVKFALDFGLVGRTGQDLGLFWRPPAMARSGWGALIGGIGSEGQRALRQPDPRSKPLLRILPTGPAHDVLKLFRNRTVYSNVVNDGIVPLRTSCLLFLDWGGLGRVEKARRENGIVGTMVGWGWAELTGANLSSQRHLRDTEAHSQASRVSWDRNSFVNRKFEHNAVPQPEESEVKDEIHAGENEDAGQNAAKAKDSSLVNPLGALLNFLRAASPKTRQPSSPKQSKIYKRSQTLHPDAEDGDSVSSGTTSGQDNSLPVRPRGVRGNLILGDTENVYAPPKTTFFEAAGDLLNPPLPSKEFITNPASRPRTIFHDRVYHPEDIPLPPLKRRISLSRSPSISSKHGPVPTDTDSANDNEQNKRSNLKVEEKIARAYHHDMSWRKVLVRLEPDAHNNICVRRMFANAYGWPVVKHLVDTHFSDSFAATTDDEKEPNREHAKPMNEAVGENGEEVYNVLSHDNIRLIDSEMRQAHDDLASMQEEISNSSKSRPKVTREESAQWDDAFFDITDDDSDNTIFNPHREGVSGDNSNDEGQGRPVHNTADTGITACLSASAAYSSVSLTSTTAGDSTVNLPAKACMDETRNK